MREEERKEMGVHNSSWIGTRVSDTVTSTPVKQTGSLSDLHSCNLPWKGRTIWKL